MSMMRVLVGTLLSLVLAMAGCSGQGPAGELPDLSGAADSPLASGTAFLIGDCVFPPRTRTAGGLVMEVPRRPVKTTRADCQAQGGHIVSPRQAWAPLAQRGDPEAQTYLADALTRGDDGTVDCQAAASLYSQATAQGDAAQRSRALFSLAYLYETGCGVPQDQERARALYANALALEGNATKAEPRVDFGRFHALVIGNDRYRHLPPLETAVNDARAVADLLRSQYGFDVRLLTDATRAQLLESLESLRRRLTEEDNLLIYYAGHGVIYDEEHQRGAWQPVDARHDSRTHWIRTRDVTDIVDTMLAHRVLIVADSCFSGAWTRSVFPDLYPDKVAFWIERLARHRARLTLASGGLEPVPDRGPEGHSVFATHFLAALNENRDILVGRRLYAYLEVNVPYETNQEPVYAPMRHAAHEGGEFFFKRVVESTADVPGKITVASVGE